MSKDYKVPTREEHNRFIRRLWKWCIGAACGVFLLTGGIVLWLFLAGYDSKKIVEVSTSVFQVLILSYGMGFFVPTLLTSLFKMSLGVEMSREGLEIGQKTASILGKVDGAIEARLERMDRILDSLEDGDHPVALDIRRAGDRIQSEVAGLREALTRPIKPPPTRIAPPKELIESVRPEAGSNGS